MKSRGGIFSVSIIMLFVFIALFNESKSYATHTKLSEANSLTYFNNGPRLTEATTSQVPGDWLNLEFIDRYHVKSTISPTTIVTDDHGTTYDLATFLDGSIFEYSSGLGYLEILNTTPNWEQRTSIDRFADVFNVKRVSVIDEVTLLTQISNVEMTIGLDEDLFGQDTGLDCHGGNDEGFFYVDADGGGGGTAYKWECATGTNDGARGLFVSSSFLRSSLANYNITYRYSSTSSAGSIVFLGNSIPYNSFESWASENYAWCPSAGAGSGSFRDFCNAPIYSTLKYVSDPIRNIKSNVTPDQLIALGTSLMVVQAVDQDNALLGTFTVAGSANASSLLGSSLSTTDNGSSTTATDPSCESNIATLGWIICPVTRLLLRGLKQVGDQGIMRSILDFDVLNSDNPGNQIPALQSIWTGFRSIANIGFVIAFFVIIYSAATGGLMSSYDVKKLLPKLLVGAVLVQLSFFISTQLISFFNDMGNGVVDIMLAPIRGAAGSVDSNIYDNTTVGWGTLTGIANAAVGILFVILIIVGAVMAFTGILMMIVVFILRNMALMVLTVVSPIAFVAWILPNTEKIFKKWWSTYIQLLALFPIAMAFLASGQLISYVWTQGSTSWLNQWVGMVALFLPYLLAPKMFSFAGSAVNGIVKAADGAKNSVKTNAKRAGESRIGTKARSGQLMSEDKRGGKLINAAAKGITNPLTTRANRFKGSRIRQTAKASDAYDRHRSENEQAANINLERDVSAMDNEERQTHLRKVATDKSQTYEMRNAAMKRMLTDSDIDGVEYAMKNMAGSSAGKSSIARFKSQNAGDLASKARHLIVADSSELADGKNLTGAGSVVTAKHDILSSQHGASVQASVAELASDDSATADKSRQKLVTMVSNYEGLDDQAKQRMDKGTVAAIHLAKQHVYGSTNLTAEENESANAVRTSLDKNRGELDLSLPPPATTNGY